MLAGLAISPQTPSTAITDEMFHAADMILIMTVHPGAGGQKFMPECIEKARELRKRFNGVEKHIQVDGGVGPGNVCDCAKAGESGVFLSGIGLVHMRQTFSGAAYTLPIIFFSSTLTSPDIVGIHNIARFSQPTIAGCNVIVAGTSVFKAPSPKEAISSLRQAVDEAWVEKLKTGQWDQ